MWSSFFLKILGDFVGGLDYYPYLCIVGERKWKNGQLNNFKQQTYEREGFNNYRHSYLQHL